MDTLFILFLLSGVLVTFFGGILLLSSILSKGKEKLDFKTFLFGILLLCVSFLITKIDLGTGSGKDISGFLGQELSQVESETGMEFEFLYGDIDYPNAKRYKYKDAFQLSVSEDTGKILQIELYDGFNIFGVTNKMSRSEQEELLFKNEFTKISDDIYRYKNTYDGIEIGLSLIYRADFLEETVLEADAKNAYKPMLPSTIGATYIGSGQMLEYASDSLAYMAYQMDNELDFDVPKIIEKYDGAYVKITGEITEIYADGSVQILTDDMEKTEELGKLWPLMSYAVVYLAEEEKEFVSLMKKDAEVVMYARVDMYSYTNLLGMKSFDLYDGVLYHYKDTEFEEVVSHPLLSSVKRGIQTPLTPSVYDKRYVTSCTEAIEAVKAYGERMGYSDPPDSFDAEKSPEGYRVFAWSSYAGSNFYSDPNSTIYYVDAYDFYNVWY